MTFLAWSPPPSPVFTRETTHRLPRLRSWLRSDTFFGLATIGVFGIGLAAGQGRAGAIPVIVGVLAAAPIVLARYSPIVGWRAAVLVSIIGAAQSSPADLDGVAGTVAVGLPLFTFVVAVSHERQIGLWAWAVTVPVVAAAMDVPVGVVAILGGLLALVTDGLWSRRRATRELTHERERAEAERTLRVTAEDRARMARDLHDVVAHHMSIVAVRAETAPYRIDVLSEEAKTEFGEISAAARESLDEIRLVLNVLRGDDASRVPQPDLSQVDDLVAATTRAGVEVELHVSGRRRPLRSALELSAYRILQESLSNVTRHAAGETAVVTLDYGEENLRLTVANTATGPVGTRGHGIIGMKERAEAVGGGVDVRDTDGRFVVEAVLPVEP